MINYINPQFFLIGIGLCTVSANSIKSIIFKVCALPVITAATQKTH